jgi:hypothetical protein
VRGEVHRAEEDPVERHEPDDEACHRLSVSSFEARK